MLRLNSSKGSRKKITVFFSCPATKRGGGRVRAWPLRKKVEVEVEVLKKYSGKKCVATKLDGGKALGAGPLKKYLYFFATSLSALMHINSYRK